MLVLDTDHMSLLEWGGDSSLALRERLADCDPQEVATTIVNYEEQVRGWMAYIARAKSLSRQVEGYRRLRSHLDNYRQIPVLDFDERAAAAFQRFRGARLKVGTMDLKIAAIVVARGGKLLSRNLRDFAKIPELVVEDWTNGKGA
ncbi:MAG TPA: type II toxin-antitoxin system VapC family toxin [Lacipirellulaceae bacterium]|nr:type II toxin-antitoxin system VapC family toxin [Lacipirellulaceae bacterium]